jgi:hypothetical protein
LLQGCSTALAIVPRLYLRFLTPRNGFCASF